MPTRGELQVSTRLAAISCEMKEVDGSQFHGASNCDEIVNSALMEIATGQNSCLQCLEVADGNDGLESVTCGWPTYR